MADLPIPSNELVVMIKEAEGFSARPYLDPVGLPTIGYGHRVPSMAHLPLTEPDAEAILMADIREKQAQALLLCPNLITHPRALDALTDLCFNVGERAVRGSRTAQLLREEQWEAAAARFRTWNKGRINGELVELPGLTRRRAKGAAWILAELEEKP